MTAMFVTKATAPLLPSASNRGNAPPMSRHVRSGYAAAMLERAPNGQETVALAGKVQPSPLLALRPQA
jgi:hypothetical protein